MVISSKEEYEVLHNIVKTKDLEGLKLVEPDLLDKHCHLLRKVVKNKWDDGIKVYQKRFSSWSWCIKNCFTILEGRCDPYAMYKYCPREYKNDTIEHINSYGRIIRLPKMMAFPYRSLEIFYRIQLYVKYMFDRIKQSMVFRKLSFSNGRFHVLTCPVNRRF